MDSVMNFLSSLLGSLLPADIFARLNVLYNGSILFLGAGVVVMLVAMVLMILSIRKNKKRAART